MLKPSIFNLAQECRVPTGVRACNAKKKNPSRPGSRVSAQYIQRPSILLRQTVFGVSLEEGGPDTTPLETLGLKPIQRQAWPRSVLKSGGLPLLAGFEK